MDNKHWISLMDELKTAKGWSSDVQLANNLGVTRTMISIVRNEKQEFTSLMKLSILHGLGRITTHRECVEAMEQCLPIKLTEFLKTIEYKDTK
jgi:hypothetical protein